MSKKKPASRSRANRGERKAVATEPSADSIPAEADGTDIANDPSVAAADSVRAAWKSRIVGHGKIAPDQLTANPLNFRKHPMKQRAALKAAIGEVGFIRSVTVNKRTGNVLDGHERVWQALTTEQPEIDVEYVDLSEEEERLALATMDAIGEMAEIDPDQLENLLSEVEAETEELTKVLEGLQSTASAGQLEGMAVDAPHPEPENQDTVRFMVALTIDQERTVREAIRAAKSRFSVDNSGSALMLALQDWMTE